MIGRNGPPFNQPLAINASSPQARGLVGWWAPLAQDGRLLDGSNLRIATSLTAITSLTDGLLGRAMSFNGSSSQVDVTDYEQLRLQTFTIVAWAKSSAAGAIVSKGDYEYGGYLLYYGDDNRIKFQTQGPALGQFNTIFNTANVYGTWHQFCMTVDVNWGLYVDGVQAYYSAGPAVGSIYYPAGACPFQIGRRASASSPYRLTGSVGEVRMYNRALSAAEVRQLYAPQTRWELYAPPSKVWQGLGTGGTKGGGSHAGGGGRGGGGGNAGGGGKGHGGNSTRIVKYPGIIRIGPG